MEDCERKARLEKQRQDALNAVLVNAAEVVKQTVATERDGNSWGH